MELSGNIFDYFIVYWAGVLVSFTPCVYPVMPITATFIAGVNTQGTRWMGFFISLVYVFGMALTYCALAVFAAITGKIFGQIQNSPWVFILVANVLIIFALVMIDVIPMPNLGLVVNHDRPKDLWAVMLMGMASGLVVGPCTAPVLGTLLLYVASKQNIVHGTSLLFVFSYGVGTSLILLGTFVGFVEKLPKSGKWLVKVKQASGVILFLLAEYFLIKAGSLMI